MLHHSKPHPRANLLDKQYLNSLYHQIHVKIPKVFDEFIRGKHIRSIFDIYQNESSGFGRAPKLLASTLFHYIVNINVGQPNNRQS